MYAHNCMTVDSHDKVKPWLQRKLWVFVAEDLESLLSLIRSTLAIFIIIENYVRRVKSLHRPARRGAWPAAIMGGSRMPCILTIV
jgi:hypothetical protein